MNLHIKQLLESLFDDDNEIDDIVNDDNFFSDIIMKYEEDRVLKWFNDEENIVLKKGNYNYKFEKDKNIFFVHDNKDGYNVDKTNIIINVENNILNIKKCIPNNINIISITCDMILIDNVDDLSNICKKLEGDLVIYNCDNIINFLNVDIPKELNGELVLKDCNNIINLDGLNKVNNVLYSLEIRHCNSILSTKGIPKIDSLIMYRCDNFKKLEDLPDEIDYISLYGLNNFRSLKGISRKVNQGLYIGCCLQLKSLKYSPEFVGITFEVIKCGLVKLEMLDSNCKVTGTFTVSNNLKLTTLENGPKKVTCNYIATGNNLIKLSANTTIMIGINAKFDVEDNKDLKEISMFNDVPIGIRLERVFRDREVIIKD